MPLPSFRLTQHERLHGGTTCPTQPVTGIDILTSHMGIPIIQVHPQGLDTAVLKASLKQALARYPLLSGQLAKGPDGLPVLLGNDAGVEFFEHESAQPMPAWGPDFHMGPFIRRFHHAIYPWQAFSGRRSLFNVAVYRHACGGVVLSLCAVHSLMDGGAFWAFMKDWSALARGQDTPDRDMGRQVMVDLGQTHLARPYTRGYLVETTWPERLQLLATFTRALLGGLEKGVLRVSGATMDRWMAEARRDLDDKERLKPADLACAQVLRQLSPLWKRGLPRCLGLVTDLRFRRGLGLGVRYFGNALAHAENEFTEEELAQGSLGALAVKCKAPTEPLSLEDLQGFLGLMERHRQQRTLWHLMMRSAARSMDAGLVLNNCSHFPMYEIDFGTGRPSWHDATRVVFRMLMPIGTPEGDGGLDLHVTLSRREIAHLKAWLAREERHTRQTRALLPGQPVRAFSEQAAVA